VAKFPPILVYCNKKSGNPDVNHPRSILRVMLCAVKQGCQMVYFHTKNTKLRTFWRALQWKMLVNVIAIWCIWRLLTILYRHLVYLMVIWYILSVLVCRTKKTGNTADKAHNYVVRVKMKMSWNTLFVQMCNK
jgi:hypothetical protein